MHLFTNPSILEQIGPRRLAKLFSEFSPDLAAANIPPPSPESENGSYFDSVAAMFQNPNLPASLRQAAGTLEVAASIENETKIYEALNRRIPSVAVSPTCALDRVLELWFQARDELAQFTQHPSTINHKPSTNLPTPDTCHSSSGSTIQPIQPVNPSTLSAIPHSALCTPHSEHSPVNGKALLDALLQLLRRFAVLPKWAAEALALWIVHTFAFHLRNVTTYIGIESPEMRCGKTTLLTLLAELVNRPIAASNISPPAFFRVIEDLAPTLLIDEVDTFLKGNDQLRGILNAGYKKNTAFVWRAIAPQAPDDSTIQPLNDSTASPHDSTIQPFNDSTPSSSSQLARFSCWCPKVMAKIGRFPATLADRCIIIRMHRKTQKEQCERVGELDAEPLRAQCAQFVQEHRAEIAAAKPQIPRELNDRAADIWEPLFAIADIAGGDWPQLARQAAINLSAATADSNPIGSLLLDIYLLFVHHKTDRLFIRDIVATLNTFTDHAWTELNRHKEINELWLSQKLRPYGIRPKTIRIGEERAKGYLQEDFQQVLGRYVTAVDLDALADTADPEPGQPQKDSEPPPPSQSDGPGPASP